MADANRGRRRALSPPAKWDLLLTGGTVITVDDERRVLDPGAVAIPGDRIGYVGTAAGTPGRARRTIDCTGRAIIPGLIDCHNHLFQGLARGVGEGMSLRPWLCDFMWPYAAAISPSEAIRRLGSEPSRRFAPAPPRSWTTTTRQQTWTRRSVWPVRWRRWACAAWWPGACSAT